MTFWLWLGICLATFNAAQPPSERFEFSQRMMGISFDITVYAPSEAVANEAAEAAYGRVRQLNAIFSDYEPDSELNRLCKTAGTGQAVKVSRELFEILETSQALSERSGGKFDVTVGPIVRMWRKTRRTKQFPTPEQLDAARALVGYGMVKLNQKAQTVELTKSGMQLDLGGIAVGYACDDVMKVLRARGLTRAMIDASGDIFCGEPPPGQPGWIIGIAPNEMDGPPTRHVQLKNAAISTAGDLYQYFEFDGVRYSHIVDPQTGLGLTDRGLVAVIAKDCTSADAWDTALSTMGPQAGLKFITEHKDAAALIIRTPAGKTEAETIESDLWKNYLFTQTRKD